jgi:hypothetical protein
MGFLSSDGLSDTISLEFKSLSELQRAVGVVTRLGSVSIGLCERDDFNT